MLTERDALRTVADAAAAYRAAYTLGLPRSAARVRLFVALDALAEIHEKGVATVAPEDGPWRPEVKE